MELLSPRVGGMGAAEGRVRAHKGTRKSAALLCSTWAFHVGMGKAGTAPAFIWVFSTLRP